MRRIPHLCHLLALVLFCASALALPPPAWGQKAEPEADEVTRAREYFRAGAQAYSVGAYAAAVQAFEQAYTLAPRPAVLFSIAQAERRLYFLLHERAHLEKALRLYREYLAKEPLAARKTDATIAIAELEPLLVEQTTTDSRPPTSAPLEPTPQQPTRIMIASPAEGALISLDGSKPERPPVIVEVVPGEHLARISAKGYESDERRILAVQGSLVNVDVSLSEKPARLLVVAPSGAELSIDGRLQGTFPFPKPLELAAGRHLITVAKRGYEPWSEERVLNRGESTDIVVQLPRTLQRTTSLVMFGAAASAMTASGVFAYFALSQQASAKSFLDARGQSRLSAADLTEYESVREDRDKLRLAALSSAGVSIALGVAGAILFNYDAKLPPVRAKSTTAYQLTPALALDFAGLNLNHDF